MVVINARLRTAAHFFFTCHVLQIWFKLLRVILYRNDLKENKNHFELARGWNYPRVGVTEGKITGHVRRKSKGNRF